MEWLHKFLPLLKKDTKANTDLSEPASLYEITIVNGDNSNYVYSDVISYEYNLEHGHLVVDLKYENNYKAIYFAAGNWKMITATKQSVKQVDVE